MSVLLFSRRLMGVAHLKCSTLRWKSDFLNGTMIDTRSYMGLNIKHIITTDKLALALNNFWSVLSILIGSHLIG